MRDRGEVNCLKLILNLSLFPLPQSLIICHKDEVFTLFTFSLHGYPLKVDSGAKRLWKLSLCKRVLIKGLNEI
jgi:hypothetical protein